MTSYQLPITYYLYNNPPGTQPSWHLGKRHTEAILIVPSSRQAKLSLIISWNSSKSVKEMIVFKNWFSILHQAVILARSRTNVSLTALRNEDLSSNVQSPALVHPQPHFNIHDTWEKPKARPHSAPSTPKEHEVAVAETSVVEIPQTKWLNYGTGFTEFKSSKLRPHTSHNSRQSSPRASLWGIRELFHPTPVSVSDQGLRSLLENTINTW